MNVKLIGVGAAGNKAAIAAIESKVIDKSDVLLINSTLKDIPHDYSGDKYCFANAYGGCGKERSVAKQYVIADLQSGALNIEKYLNIGVQGKQTELVVFVSSTEGGSGSGTVPTLARYIKEVVDTSISVKCFSFVGFSDDIRGLRNTVEYFQEMEDNLAIEALLNDKYLDEAGGDRIKAEQMANQDFCIKLSVLMGNALRDSDHNIDPTDHLKVVKTPNYSVTEYKEFGKIKNKSQFRELIQDMIDNTKGFDLSTQTQKRLAVMINIDKTSTGVIDTELLLEHFGEAFEKFEHIQHETSLPQFVAFISSGNKIPMDEIQSVYKQYQERANKMDNSPDDFFGKNFKFDDQDDVFNLSHNEKKKSKADFFGSLNDSKESKASSLKEGDLADF